MKSFSRIIGQVVRGFGAASGRSNDQRFLNGTIQEQRKYFIQKGIDFHEIHNGTINIATSDELKIKRARHEVNDLSWSENMPAENFLFFDSYIQTSNKMYQGWLYLPFKDQPKLNLKKLEFLMPKLPNLNEGDQLEVFLNDEQIIVS